MWNRSSCGIDREVALSVALSSNRVKEQSHVTEFSNMIKYHDHLQWSVMPRRPAPPPCRPCDQCSGAGLRPGSSLLRWPGAATGVDNAEPASIAPPVDPATSAAGQDCDADPACCSGQEQQWGQGHVDPGCCNGQEQQRAWIMLSQPAWPPCRPCDQCSRAGLRRGSSLLQGSRAPVRWIQPVAVARSNN